MFAKSFEDVEILDAAAGAESLPFASIREALAELRAGRMIVIVDDQDRERADALELNPMVLRNTSWGGTAFTVSVDAKGRGVTTGISAYDRAQTVLATVDAATRPEDLARPGHIFPLRSRRNGVLERRGHTEAAVDLARLAGLNPSGVICEIANDDGAMACLPDLVRFCSKYDLAMVSVADLAQYRWRMPE
jgi:3,4-dihydroxy 2-butanone 4-phosphate synthase/GTP cyclohydrolase II